MGFGRPTVCFDIGRPSSLEYMTRGSGGDFLARRAERGRREVAGCGPGVLDGRGLSNEALVFFGVTRFLLK